MKMTLTILCIFLFPLLLTAQEILGSWRGTLEAGGSELIIVFNITKEGDDYQATMDSPDQGVRGIHVSSVEFEDGEVIIQMTNPPFIYKGTYNDGEIRGTFTQSGMSFPLDLSPGGAEPVLRPQEPQPPFPYRSEEVRFENHAAGVILAGTLTLPATGGKFPAVVMVTGSGPQNRDEEVFDHKPFLVIADHLTRSGIAVLRYDDRGTAESTGSFAGSTSEDFTGDALAGFDFLRRRTDIDPDKIGVIGHSEGGTIGFMMAARQPELAFVVSMAGGILPGDSVLVLQNRDILLAQGMDNNLVGQFVNAVAAMYKIKNSTDVAYVKDNLDQIKERIPGLTGLWEPLQNSIVESLLSTDPWFNYFVKNDPAGDIAKTRCPVFAINGAKDVQVHAENNLSHLTDILRSAGNDNFTTRIYPGLNHLFQQCVTGTVEEYGRIEQTIAPEVLEEMTEWILRITGV